MRKENNRKTVSEKLKQKADSFDTIRADKYKNFIYARTYYKNYYTLSDAVISIVFISFAGKASLFLFLNINSRLHSNVSQTFYC